jgi:hypothetical protein
MNVPSFEQIAHFLTRKQDEDFEIEESNAKAFEDLGLLKPKLYIPWPPKEKYPKI